MIQKTFTNRDNQFFVNLFKKQNNIFCPRKCLRWLNFLLNHPFKVNNDFLVHYGAGRDPFEEKPLNYICLGEIQKYDIIFTQHSQDYDFYHFEKLGHDFLVNVKVG